MTPMPDDIDAEAIVARARAEADVLLARAEVEALALRGRTEADAQAVRARARVEADELEARARNDREHAARLLADAQERSEQLVAEAEEVRRSADLTIERLVATRRELEAVIEHLARLPNTVLDLTEHPLVGVAAREVLPAALVDVLDADALADAGAVPLGASVRNGELDAPGDPGFPRPSVGEPTLADVETLPTAAEDPVARMVRSAIDRASRAASEPSGWSGGPGEPRESGPTGNDPD